MNFSVLCVENLHMFSCLNVQMKLQLSLSFALKDLYGFSCCHPNDVMCCGS